MTPWEYSAYLRRFIETKDPDQSWLMGEGSRAPDDATIRAEWSALSSEPTAVFDRKARQLRQRMQAGLIYRLLAGIDALEDTVRVTTVMAEAALQASLDHHRPLLEQAFGAPADPRFVVLGMGKLGGCELNLSSDIDIFCVYASDGETAGPRVRDHGEFFTRLTQAMAKSLDQQTEDGFVARVDQRLRPWGSAGRLAIPAAACEDYYEVHGREWERFALLKARPVAGDLALGESLLASLRPFMYRKYLDFGVFESIRDLKAKIETEVRRSGKESNVKVGRGGIREAEFIVQAMQLLRGGQIPALQVTGFLRALPALMEAQIFPQEEGAALEADYRWLRHVEHVLQAANDQQTQALPEDKTALASILGFASAEAFEARRVEVTNRVHTAFSAFMRVDVAESETVGPVSETVAIAIAEMRDDPACERLEPVARGRLIKLLDQLAPELSTYPPIVTERVLKFVGSCVRRSAYLALLSENPGTRAMMLDVLNRSSWIADRLLEMPALLDELLILRPEDAVLSRQAIGQELTVRLQRIDPDDTERLTETLVQFARGMAFRVAVCEVRGEIPLMKVSDQLTWIAEAVVTEVLHYAYRESVNRHGAPRSLAEAEEGMGLAVLGYGKLGGLEMSYGSDLDLVFVHAVDAEALTQGAQPIEGSVFVNRVVRRVIALLETTTRFGKLYEIDTRLRPSGRSGLMVVGLDALQKYLDESAWTWELQAFVRARPVAGDSHLANALVDLRRDILIRRRDPKQLLADVVEMREKMRTHLATPPGEIGFDLKHDQGGIVDIEFMVQYRILASAEMHPELAHYTDNVRQLDGLADAGCITVNEAEALKAAYVRYRALNHEVILAGRSGRIDEALISDERAQVMSLWAQWMTVSY